MKNYRRDCLVVEIHLLKILSVGIDCESVSRKFDVHSRDPTHPIHFLAQASDLCQQSICPQNITKVDWFDWPVGRLFVGRGEVSR